MSEMDNLVLEHLKHISGFVDQLASDMKDVKVRLQRLETRIDLRDNA